MKRKKTSPNPVFPAGGRRAKLLRSMWKGWAHWSHILDLLNRIDEGSRPVTAGTMRATATIWGLRRPFGRGRYARDVQAAKRGIKL